MDRKIVNKFENYFEKYWKFDRITNIMRDDID